MSVIFVHDGSEYTTKLFRAAGVRHGTEPAGGLDEDCTIVKWDGGWLEKGRVAASHGLDQSRDALSPFTINRAEAVRRYADPVQREGLLALHGISIGGRPAEDSVNSVGRSGRRFRVRVVTPNVLRPRRIFAVLVFDTEALALFEHPANGANRLGDARLEDALHSEIGIETNNRLHRRLLHISYRSVYALGLDYAVVYIELADGERLRVIHVDVYPPLTEPILRQTAAAIWRYAQGLALEKSRIEPVVMGMDPEFILRMPEIGLVSADRYLDKRGTAGCDAMRYRGQKVVFPLAELRPEPSADIYELFGNLRKAMHMAAKRIDPKLEWIAGGMPHKGFPLGGHLHFSGIWLNNKLLRALDAGLALPLTLIEDDTTRLRRPRYGFLGDARRKRHGGFEYRTLPSWIVTPGITIGVLALAKLIVDHYASLSDFERIDESTDDASLLHFEQLDETTVRAYYEGDKKTLLPIVERKWRVLEELPSYAQYERYLAPLKRRILSCQPWNEHQDFRPAWKIRR